VRVNELSWSGNGILRQGQGVRWVIVAVALEAAALGLEATLDNTDRE
jgi:hypothetical protein